MRAHNQVEIKSRIKVHACVLFALKGWAAYESECDGVYPLSTMIENHKLEGLNSMDGGWSTPQPYPTLRFFFPVNRKRIVFFCKYMFSTAL